jgi:hypothetical protein
MKMTRRRGKKERREGEKEERREGGKTKVVCKKIMGWGGANKQGD